MPRKVFVAGEILTASDVNTNLMDQSVMVFDDASARTTAIPTPVEGMVTYRSDDDVVEVFDGSAYKRVGGGLVAVKSAINTGPEVFSSVSGGGQAVVPDLSITHEVADSSNRLIITAVFGLAGNSHGQGNVGIIVHDGTGNIGGGASTGSRTPVSAGGFITGSGATPVVANPSITFVHTPGSGSKTYTVRAVNILNAPRNLFINRAESDLDAVERSRGISSLVIQEVSV